LQIARPFALPSAVNLPIAMGFALALSVLVSQPVLVRAEPSPDAHRSMSDQDRLADRLERLGGRVWQELSRFGRELSNSADDAHVKSDRTRQSWNEAWQNWQRQAAIGWSITRQRLLALTQHMPRSLAEVNAVVADALDQLSRWLRGDTAPDPAPKGRGKPLRI
jgi:hypothetical protein